MGEFIVDNLGWFIAIGIILVILIALAIVTWYGLRYSLTDEDKQTVLPGDDYLDPSKEDCLDGGGLAITINTSPEVVWRHLRQMGQDRAGWYSFEHLERLFTFKIHNHYTIHEEWQDFGPGRFLFYHQPPWGLGSDVIEVDEEHHMFGSVSDSRKEPTVENSIHFVPPFAMQYFCWTWNFGAVDKDDGTTRLITKCKVGFEPYTRLRVVLVATILGLPSYIMLSHQFNLLKRICEGTKKIDEKHR